MRLLFYRFYIEIQNTQIRVSHYELKPLNINITYLLKIKIKTPF